ncbi:MAG: HAD family hydrolase [Ethanoligenens sp.]
MNDIKGILFDKDGTILDNDLLWGPVGNDVADYVTEIYCLTPDERKSILRAIGLDGPKLLANSPLASGTVGDVTDAVEEALCACGKDKQAMTALKQQVTDAVERAIQKNAHLIRPLGNVRKLFDFLKSRRIAIGLATADLYNTTMICLKQLGIGEDFQFIGTDDGRTRPKPSPDLLENFCATCGLDNREVAVVGDSVVDMQMGLNGGAGLLVAIVPERDENQPSAKDAQYVIETVEELIPLFS